MDDVSIVRVSCHTFPHSDDVGVVCARVRHRYRYELEAFVDKIRGREPEHWFDAQDSITNLEWIEAVYKEVGYNIIVTCSHPRFNSYLLPAILRRMFTNFPVLSQTGLGSRPPSTAEVPTAAT